MATPGFSFTVKELRGSPKFRITEAGLSCTRRFKCPWGDWQNVAAALMGMHTYQGSVSYETQRLPLPGWPNCFATTIDIDPRDAAAPDNDVGMDLLAGDDVEDMNTYSTLMTGNVEPYNAIITANYETLFATSVNEVHPSLSSSLLVDAPGTYVSYERDLGGEIMLAEPGTFKWADDDKPVQSPAGIVIPKATHLLTWFWVIDPPWDVIDKTIGKVNSSSFLGRPAGTVLFLGGQPVPAFRMQSSEDGTSMYYKLPYRFMSESKYKVDGTTIVGWNYLYKKTPASGTDHWIAIKNSSGDAPYGSANFDNLFKYASKQS